MHGPHYDFAPSLPRAAGRRHLAPGGRRRDGELSPPSRPMPFSFAAWQQHQPRICVVHHPQVRVLQVCVHHTSQPLRPMPARRARIHRQLVFQRWYFPVPRSVHSCHLRRLHLTRRRQRRLMRTDIASKSTRPASSKVVECAPNLPCCAQHSTVASSPRG